MPTTVVLVVDDDDSVTVIRRVCETAGFTLLCADDASVVGLVQRHTPGAIIVPRAHGDLDVLVRIAELRDAAPDALVIIAADDDNDLTVLDAGADIVIPRPIDERRVAGALQMMCAQAEATTTPPRLALVIVEPDPHLAGVMLRWLGGAFDATLVATGWRAVELVRERRPDAVLAELRLPDMDAAELHAQLDRTAPGLGERVLFMTAGFVADKSQLFLARIPGQWIYKPFDLARLRAALAGLFD